MSVERMQGACCYCAMTAPEVTFAKREHVIPQAFGVFEHNLIAPDVCDDCNAFFGKELDRVLARGSFEGQLRYQLGDKRATEYNHAGKSTRVRSQARSGPWLGMLLDFRPSPDGKELIVVPAKQIGFAPTRDGEFEFFRLHEVPSKADCLERYGKRVYLRAAGFASEEETREVLEKLGFLPLDEYEIDQTIVTEGTQARVQSDITVDRLLFRAIAKIAFNYLISSSPAVARMSQFDSVRNFIRHDREPGFHVVQVDPNPVLGGAPRYYGHVLALRFEPETRSVMASVSLYNWMHYRVVLSPTGFLIATPSEFLTTGHFFDSEHKVISTLAHVSELIDRLTIRQQ